MGLALPLRQLFSSDWSNNLLVLFNKTHQNDIWSLGNYKTYKAPPNRILGLNSLTASNQCRVRLRKLNYRLCQMELAVDDFTTVHHNCRARQSLHGARDIIALTLPNMEISLICCTSKHDTLIYNSRLQPILIYTRLVICLHHHLSSH